MLENIFANRNIIFISNNSVFFSAKERELYKRQWQKKWFADKLLYKIPSQKPPGLLYAFVRNISTPLKALSIDLIRLRAHNEVSHKTSTCINVCDKYDRVFYLLEKAHIISLIVQKNVFFLLK